MEVFARQSILQILGCIVDWHLEHLANEAPLPDGGTQEVNDTAWVRGASTTGSWIERRTCPW